MSTSRRTSSTARCGRPASPGRWSPARASRCRSCAPLSAKAAFGWHALLRTPYTTQLVEAVAGLNDPAGGWYAGRYEAGGKPNQSLNANTNAVVLESLAYMARGPLLRYR